MARFTVPMERRLGELEKEYDMAPQREEEPGMFGPRGFIGNIRDYYQMDSWGDWWRGLFGGRRERSREPTVYPHWGEKEIKNLRNWMKETE